MSLKVYSPQFTVIVRKRVVTTSGAASRVTASSRLIDLTPLLGEGGSVTTTKTIRGGNPGGFSITIPDQPDKGAGRTLDSLYGLVEPMDYVEIRGARSPEQYAGGSLPIIMRGFVNRVSRSESVGGRPERNVTITGHDYGKIPQIVVLFPRGDFATTSDYLSVFPLYLQTGYNPLGSTAGEFMTKSMEIVNNWLGAMYEVAGFTGSNGLAALPLIGLDVDTTPGVVAPFGASPIDGSMWNFMTMWSDADWNELFIEDREVGPTLVYRPKPFRQLGSGPGAPIQGTPMFCLNQAGQPLVVTTGEIEHLESSRSDSDVGNYFWVTAPRATLVESELLNYTSFSSGPYAKLLDESPNNDPRLYGVRPMLRQTQQSSSALLSNLSNQVPAQRVALIDQLNAWMMGRRTLLAELNRDNAIFEEGLFQGMGNERIRPGNYLNMQRGTITWDVYVHTVTHQFRPFQSFTTAAQYDRGTNFYKRQNIPGSPAYAENPTGVYP